MIYGNVGGSYGSLHKVPSIAKDGDHSPHFALSLLPPECDVAIVTTDEGFYPGYLCGYWKKMGDHWEFDYTDYYLDIDTQELTVDMRGEVHVYNKHMHESTFSCIVKDGVYPIAGSDRFWLKSKNEVVRINNYQLRDYLKEILQA